MKKILENAITGIVIGGFISVFLAVVYRTVKWILGF